MTEANLALLQRWLTHFVVLALIGAATWVVWVRRVALSHAEPSLPSDELRSAIGELTRRVERIGLGSAVLLLPAWILGLAVQVIGFRDPFVPLREDVAFLVGESFWGSVWVAQGCVAVALILCFLFLVRTRHVVPRDPERVGTEGGHGRIWWLIVAFVLALPVTQALSSHAMSEDGIHRAIAVGADALHGLAAGAWIGSLGIILVNGYRSPHGATILAPQLRAFSPMALLAVPMLVGMGGVLAVYHLSALSDLWEAPYGRMLTAKVLVAGIVLWLGFRNWRRGLPAIDTRVGMDTVRRRAAWEVGTAVIVLGITATLTGLTVP